MYEIHTVCRRTALLFSRLNNRNRVQARGDTIAGRILVRLRQGAKPCRRHHDSGSRARAKNSEISQYILYHICPRIANFFPSAPPTPEKDCSKQAKAIKPLSSVPDFQLTIVRSYIIIEMRKPACKGFRSLFQQKRPFAQGKTQDKTKADCIFVCGRFKVVTASI